MSEPSPSPSPSHRTGVPVRVRWALGASALAALGIAGGLVASSAGAAPPPSSGSTTPVPAAAPTPKVARAGNGLVATATPTSLTITTLTGLSRTFALTSSTTLREGHAVVSPSALSPGVHVAVRVVHGSSPTDPTASAVIVVRPAVGGRVVSLSGTSGAQTIVVRPLSGLDETIVTSGSTVIKEPGTLSGRPTVAVGDVVSAVGQVNSSHTALDATAMALRPYR